MRFLVAMGPHRLVIEAVDRSEASAELDRRLTAMGLERGDVEWTEL